MGSVGLCVLRRIHRFNETLNAQERSQHDAIGYITDYLTKRQPVAIKEIKKFVEGHHQLHKQLQSANVSIQRSAIRHVQRLLSDFLGRGTARKAVECTNLIVCRCKHDVTRAESIKSHLLVSLPCGDFVRFQEAVSKQGGDAEDTFMSGLEIDHRNPGMKRLVSRQHAPSMYGYRGNDMLVQHLSPWEFQSGWEIQRAVFPKQSDSSRREHTTDGVELIPNNESCYHALLTPVGQAKLKANETLMPGDDYMIRAEEGMTRHRHWIAFPASSPFRNDWVMVQRAQPAIPRFDGPALAVGGSSDDHARHMSIYFRPWTLMATNASEYTPLITDIGDGSWSSAWRSYLDGNVLSMRCKHAIQNFQAVFSAREGHDQEESASRPDLEELCLKQSQLKQVIQTKRRGSGKHANAEAEAAASEAIESSFSFVRAAWGRMSGAKGVRAQSGPHAARQDIAELVKAAQKARNKSKSKAREASVNAAAASAVVHLSSENPKKAVHQWVRDMTHQEEFKCKNAEQKEVVDLISKRVLEEIADAQHNRIGSSEPIRVMVAGAPGVGKSFVSQSAILLFERLGYVRGVHFQTCALQAVVAKQSEGETMHSLNNLNLWGQPNTSASAISSGAAKLTHMRWLIIDEISQLTCELIAQCEKQTRCMVQDVGTYRLAADKSVRPWAGINILYVGDFRQLPPPGAGMCLSTIPDSAWMRLYPKKSSVTQGLNLIWEETTHLIELVEQIRSADDPWWNEVLHEYRLGALTESTHAFLHGNKTTVPGGSYY